VPVVDIPLLPAKYFRQFPQKDMPVKNKTPIEKGVKAKEMLDRILEGEMKLTPKELWTVAPKLQAALKKILISKCLNKNKSREDKDQEKKDSQPQKKMVLVNSLESPEKQQEVIEIEDSKVVKVWAMVDPVLQFLEKLSPEECSCQIFTIEEEKEKEERVAPDMAHLRVVLAVINGIRKEVLLDNGSQIVLVTKKVAVANKVSWDPSLSIQMQSVNKSLLRMCGLVVNCFAKKYKPVALKVKLVLGTLPERFRITREIIGDPLQGITNGHLLICDYRF